MKDLDFDELDRAVTTLMGNVPKTTEPVKQDDVKTLIISSTLTDDKPPVLPVGEANIVTEPQVSAASRKSGAAHPISVDRPAPLATRRSGRFMDVVAPSPSGRKSMPSQAVSRQGVTIAPAVDNTPVNDDHSAPVSSAASIEVEAPAEPASRQGEWPDPLEFNQEMVSQVTAEEPVTAREPVSVPHAESPEPLTSPFLADAKVEKRPLGTPEPGLQMAQHSEAEVTAPEDDEVSASGGPAVSDDTQIYDVVLPEELQNNLISIESDASEEQEVFDAPKEVSKPVEIHQEEHQSELPKTPAPVQAAATLTGSGSITQQYREEPSTSDQTTGSIYDTASYHQPLEHPAQKKTGWLWVLWVVVLLILGAGGGALAYLYLLQ